MNWSTLFHPFATLSHLFLTLSMAAFHINLVHSWLAQVKVRDVLFKLAAVCAAYTLYSHIMSYQYFHFFALSKSLIITEIYLIELPKPPILSHRNINLSYPLFTVPFVGSGRWIQCRGSPWHRIMAFSPDVGTAGYPSRRSTKSTTSFTSSGDKVGYGGLWAELDPLKLLILGDSQLDSQLPKKRNGKRRESN